MTNISTETVSLVQAADGERDGHARAPNGRAARGRRLRRRRAAKQAKIGARLVKMLGISPVAAAHLIGGNRTYVYAWMRIERSGIHDLRCDVLAGKIPLPAAAANTPRLNRSNVG